MADRQVAMQRKAPGGDPCPTCGAQRDATSTNIVPASKDYNDSKKAYDANMAQARSDSTVTANNTHLQSFGMSNWELRKLLGAGQKIDSLGQVMADAKSKLKP
jgi:hypothetical protein